MTQWLPLVLLVAASAVFLGDAARVQGPKNANPRHPGARKTVQINNETFYFSGDDSQNWYDARSKCGLAGMRLVTLDTPERWQMIKDYLLANPEYNFWTWTSGQKHSGSEQFIWDTTGEDFTYYDWNPAEPDLDPFEEACMNFYVDIGGWDDDKCMSTYMPFMCETLPQ